MPGWRPCRASPSVSAEPPASLPSPDHPLHAILVGFSETDDDVLADFERGHNATVEPGPPAYPSARRLLNDEPEQEAFTPPVPGLPTRELAGVPSTGRRKPRHARCATPGLRPLASLVPRLAWPSPKLTAILVALVVVVAVATSSSSGPPPTTSGPVRSGPQLDAARSPYVVARRGRARRIRRHPARVERAIRSRARVTAAPAPQRGPAQNVNAATGSPAAGATAARRTYSHFTTEFTP
jgi:hypothetical protein